MRVIIHARAEPKDANMAGGCVVFHVVSQDQVLGCSGERVDVNTREAPLRFWILILSSRLSTYEPDSQF